VAGIVERAIGAGRAVTSGFGGSADELDTLLQRALRPATTAPRSGDVGIAIVGYGPFGGMGYAHGLGIRATDGLELVAVVDPSDERRKAAEDDFPGVTAYAGIDDLVGDSSVDLAIVATPPSAHFELTRTLLRAGKHVACEKPLCLTAAEADELIATAATSERVLTVHQNRRWDADFRAVRRAVRAGLLGELFNVETFVGGFDHPCRAWHSDVEVSGGAVYDWGSHHVDWIVQLLGSAPDRVTTFGHKRVWHDVTNLDQLRLHLSWDDGREAEFFQSDVAAVRRPKFYVQGTAGTLVGEYRPLTFERLEPGRGYVADRPHHAEAPADLRLARYESGYGITETRLPPAPEDRFGFPRNLADHLHLREPLAVTPESVRDVIAVLEASQRSSDAGGTVVHL
jgi:predicted dehydrogenase